MVNYNKVILAGNVTRDVEVRHTQGGIAIAKFGMAVNRKQGEKESVCFVDCTAFGKQAELLGEHIHKGSSLLVDGRLELETWEAKDGSGKRSKHGVVVENFQFLDSKGDKPAARSGGSGGYHRDDRRDQQDHDDIPF